MSARLASLTGPALFGWAKREDCRLRGGNVTVASEFGKGSCFTLRVPARPLHLPNEEAGEQRLVA
jgi:hypothetical protein